MYVDLFGGSGLLSHTVKALKPHAKVIYNDFDGYAERLDNIEKTNALLQDLRDILRGAPRGKRIGEGFKEKVLARVEKETGYIDFVTLSSSLLFTMRFVNSKEELGKKALYNNVPLLPYNTDGYLSGLTRVRADYGELLEEYRDRNALFIFDPPYLNTDNTRYENARYWRTRDYLRVLKAMQDVDYIYFTSEKSQIEELFSFLEKECRVVTPFTGAQRARMHTGKGYNVNYADWIYYRIRNCKAGNPSGPEGKRLLKSVQ